MKAYKYRIYPNREQIVLLERTFGCCRFVWNHLLGLNKDLYALYKEGKGDKPNIGYAQLCLSLTMLKQNMDYIWLNDISSIALQQKVKDLADAWQSSFKITGRGLPQFKSKHRNHNSFRIVGTSRLKDGKLYLPKDNRGLKIRWTRGLPSEPSSYTISKTPDGKYWISFVCKDYDPIITNGTGSIGIDLGLKDMVVDSDGTKYTSPKFYRKSLERLAKAQRVLSRRIKGSKRRNKARLRVAKLHAKIHNQRKDYAHKLSRKLVNENQVIGIEDLAVRNWVKNRRLAMSTMDASLGMFRRFLEYKAIESKHTGIVLMDKWYPSTHLCTVCRKRPTVKLALNARSWTCEFCGTEHDRDHNAAMNIKAVTEWVFKSHKEPKGTIVLAPCLRVLKQTMPVAPVRAQSISKH
jgi:putative transposase